MSFYGGIIIFKSISQKTSQDEFLTYDISKNDLVLNGQIKKFNDQCYDVSKKFDFDDIILNIVKRHIDNGDIFLFFDIKNPKKQKIYLKLDEIIDIHNFDRYYEKPDYDNRYGENKITGPFAYLDLIKGSAIISKLYYFKELRFLYDNSQYSSVYELADENCNIGIKDNLVTVTISDISKNCSFFILLSNEKLFKNIENLEFYFERYFEGIKNNCIVNSYFVKFDGTYTKLPYSIEPFTKEGYGFSLHHSSKIELLPFLDYKKDRYFYDFIINAIMQSFIYQKNDNGVFYSTYTSTWLKKDTGITAPYIDTRENETFNYLLTEFKKLCPDFSIQDNTQNYCDFLIKQVKLNNVYQLEDGIFFPDYFKNNMEFKTHSSLNHQLGIINLMLNVYQKTKMKKYLNIAKKMLLFLDITHNMWINPSNNDLYYGLKMVNDQMEIFGKDYVYVTLMDLLRLRKNLVMNFGINNSKINDLIQSKIKYLNASGFSIFNPNAKLALGETIDSRKKALELYDEYLLLNKR